MCPLYGPTPTRLAWLVGQHAHSAHKYALKNVRHAGMELGQANGRFPLGTCTACKRERVEVDVMGGRRCIDRCNAAHRKLKGFLTRPGRFGDAYGHGQRHYAPALDAVLHRRMRDGGQFFESPQWTSGSVREKLEALLQQRLEDFMAACPRRFEREFVVDFAEEARVLQIEQEGNGGRGVEHVQHIDQEAEEAPRPIERHIHGVEGIAKTVYMCN